jgi:hypothetical protein
MTLKLFTDQWHSNDISVLPGPAGQATMMAPQDGQNSVDYCHQENTQSQKKAINGSYYEVTA